MTDDSQLLVRLRQHEAQALAEFLCANERPLLAFVDRQLGAALRRKIEIEDIFQEVSAEARCALPDTDLTDRDPFSWLCQIAERRIIDAHRRFFGAKSGTPAARFRWAARAATRSRPRSSICWWPA